MQDHTSHESLFLLLTATSTCAGENVFDTHRSKAIKEGSGRSQKKKKQTE